MLLEERGGWPLSSKRNVFCSLTTDCPESWGFTPMSLWGLLQVLEPRDDPGIPHVSLVGSISIQILGLCLVISRKCLGVPISEPVS